MIDANRKRPRKRELQLLGSALVVAALAIIATDALVIRARDAAKPSGAAQDARLFVGSDASADTRAAPNSGAIESSGPRAAVAFAIVDAASRPMLAAPVRRSAIAPWGLRPYPGDSLAVGAWPNGGTRPVAQAFARTPLVRVTVR